MIARIDAHLEAVLGDWITRKQRRWVLWGGLFPLASLAVPASVVAVSPVVGVAGLVGTTAIATVFAWRYRPSHAQTSLGVGAAAWRGADWTHEHDAGDGQGAIAEPARIGYSYATGTMLFGIVVTWVLATAIW